MTKEQHHLYREVLWPAAMRAQGWDRLSASEQDRLRRALTLEATGMKTDSCANVDHLDGFTALKKLLLHYAGPLDLKAARAVANPEETQLNDKRGRLIFKINSLGFHRNYVQAIAKWKCRQFQVSRWEDLPLQQINFLLYTVNKNRLKKGMPIPPRAPKPTGHPVQEYTLRAPRKTVAGPF
jgi:hypothetical protein